MVTRKRVDPLLQSRELRLEVRQDCPVGFQPLRKDRNANPLHLYMEHKHVEV